MSGHVLPPRDRYQLRNDPTATFQLESSAEGRGTDGCVVRIAITRHDGHGFRYEVVFSGDYVESKPNFTAEMYHETALAVARSQIESHVHRDTRITVQANSGLPRSQVGVHFDWEKP